MEPSSCCGCAFSLRQMKYYGCKIKILRLMGLDTLKQLFKHSPSADAAAPAEPSSAAPMPDPQTAAPRSDFTAAEKKALFKDVSLNDFTPSPFPAGAEQPFAVPENLRAPQPMPSPEPSAADNFRAPPEPALSPDLVNPAAQPPRRDTAAAPQSAAGNVMQQALDVERAHLEAAAAAEAQAAPQAEQEQPMHDDELLAAQTKAMLDDIQQDQDNLVAAAQYQPFEVNYQTKSPNYDELAQERQQNVDDHVLSSFNDREVLPLKLTVILYLRQLAAAIFSHTSLSLVLPRLSMQFGPCYPSSMALPYLVSGAVAGVISMLICYGTDTRQLTGGFCLFFYILITGLAAFRGIAELVGLITKRRPDEILNTAALLLPSLLLIFIINVIFVYSEPFEGGILFAFASMLSACFASTLAFDLKQDPVDSFGTMSVKGVLFCTVLILFFSLLTLKLYAACSVAGLGLLLRLIIGHIYLKHNVTASRQMICAAQFIIMLMLLFDLLLLSRSDNILCNQIYELLSAHHLITSAL